MPRDDGEFSLDHPRWTKPQGARQLSHRVFLPSVYSTGKRPCASCARPVEKQLGNLSGVRRAAVEYDPAQFGIRDLMVEIKHTGYEAAGTAKAEFVVDDSARPSGSSQQLEEHLDASPGVVKSNFNLATRTVQTPIRFTPDKTGEFTFTCVMNMMRGKLIVNSA